MFVFFIGAGGFCAGAQAKTGSIPIRSVQLAYVGPVLYNIAVLLRPGGLPSGREQNRIGA